MDGWMDVGRHVRSIHMRIRAPTRPCMYVYVYVCMYASECGCVYVKGGLARSNGAEARLHNQQTHKAFRRCLARLTDGVSA